MDQTLVLKLEQYHKALDSLKTALTEPENPIVRDSVIKRFEFTYELCWKNAKVYLNNRFGVDVFSPKDVFRELRKNGLSGDEETETLLMMVDERNKIIHTYSENFSNELYQRIKDNYFNLLAKIYQVLKVF
jgi:nucleotidyltransferase substrate binding protein (TIGR01987 family)